MVPISSHPHTTHPHRAGDRLQFIGSYDLRSVTKKEALEIIRSCDQVSVDVMIRRTATLQKPLPQVCVGGVGGYGVRVGGFWSLYRSGLC